MSLFYIILAAVVVPVLFLMLTWVGVTTYRILFPEEPLAPSESPTEKRREATTAGRAMPVGAREIREDQRFYFAKRSRRDHYSYHHGDSDGFPDPWLDNLWLRRN